MTEYILPVRVYYEDTDSGGVVYHANYLKFMERARTEWLRAQGLEQDRIARDFGVLFAVRAMQIDFLLPARFNQALQVSAKVSKFAPASIVFEQQVRLADSVAEKPLCQAMVKVACLSVDGLRPKAIPNAIKLEMMGGR